MIKQSYPKEKALKSFSTDKYHIDIKKQKADGMNISYRKNRNRANSAYCDNSNDKLNLSNQRTSESIHKKHKSAFNKDISV